MNATKRILFVGLALMITACTPTEKIIERQSSNDNPVRKIEVQDDMDAEQMALAGEQLLSVWNFMLADKVFNWSLSKDPTNKRAQFYSALLKPIMVTKGLAVRVRPYYRNNGGTKSLDKTLDTLPNSSLKTFLTDGVEDIKDLKDVQTLLVQERDAWNDLRKFLIANQTMNLVLNMNPMTFQDKVNKGMSENCKIEEDGDHNVVVTCDYAHAFEKKVNVADLLALRQMAASEVLFLSLYTSYSVDGLESLFKLDQKNLTEQQRIEYVENNLPAAAKLRKDNNLSLIPDLGSDFLTAARWVLQYQQSLCPQKTSWSSVKRPGYLVDGNDFCIYDMSKTEQDLVIFESALHGPISVVLTTKENIKKSTQVNYLALITNPVEDLRSLAPSSFNACGKAASLRDKTMGGTFPLADAEDFNIEKCRN